MQFGDKKAEHYTGSSMMCKFLMHNWAHIRVIIEAKGLLCNPVIQSEMEHHYINGIHGERNLHQAIYVSGPRGGERGTQMRILRESDNKDMPWTCFEVQFAQENASRITKILPIVNLARGVRKRRPKCCRLKQSRVSEQANLLPKLIGNLKKVLDLWISQLLEATSLSQMLDALKDAAKVHGK